MKGVLEIQTKKEKAMKSTLIRLLSIMTLATSMTAFALPEKGKDSAKSAVETKCAPAARDTQMTAPDAGRSNSDQEESGQKKIEKQNKQWLHDVQNMVAG